MNILFVADPLEAAGDQHHTNPPLQVLVTDLEDAPDDTPVGAVDQLVEIHQRLGEEASARASFYVYTDRDDIDRLAEALIKVERLFARN